MSRTKLLSLLAVALTAIVPTIAQASTLSHYADTVIDVLQAPIYLRLNEASGVTLGTQVTNSGTLGSSLLMNWGVHSSSTAFYANSNPVSGVTSLGPSVSINGYACLGLEGTNTGARLTAYAANASNSTAFNVYDNTSVSGEKVAVMDNENMTYSFFFKTTDNYQNPRVITSHSENSNRFDLIMSYGKWGIITGNYSATTPTNWLADSSTSFNDGNWHHLVAVRNGDDADNAVLYVDGQEISLTATTATPTYMTGGASPQAGSVDAGYGLRIGTHGNKNRGWTGTLDEVAMWGEALSSEQATGLFYAVTVPEPSSLILVITLLLGATIGARRKFF